MKHIEFEKILRHFEGLQQSPTEAREISEHLRACRECAALFRRLESFFNYVAATAQTEQVSPADTARLLNIFQPKKSAAREKSLLQKMLASLVFDDWQTVLHERFSAISDSRHLLYRAGDFEIDLRLRFTDGGNCQVSGQIFPDCSLSATAEFYSAETSEKVFLNDCGEFVFPPLKEGEYNFRISSGETIIEIENLSLVN